MDPPRRPLGSGWLQNADSNNKNQPALAPTPDRSQITRTIPLPTDLVARNGDKNDEVKNAKELEKEENKEEEEEEEEEQLCAICQDQLPDVGRGILACGHVYCFQCIHQWCKTQNDCPGCRVEIKRIVKTLSADDVAKEEARQKLDFERKCSNKKQLARAKRRAKRVKIPMEDVVTKTIRIRPKSLKPTPAQQRAAPHPQAPGGWMHAEAQEAQRQAQAARQREEDLERISGSLRRRWREAQLADEGGYALPPLSRGTLAAMVGSSRQPVDEDSQNDLSPEEVETIIRDQSIPHLPAPLPSTAAAATAADAADADVDPVNPALDPEDAAMQQGSAARGEAVGVGERGSVPRPVPPPA
ncbi:unnamed protein product [Pylaiella littoralis]